MDAEYYALSFITIISKFYQRVPNVLLDMIATWLNRWCEKKDLPPVHVTDALLRQDTKSDE